VWILSHPQPSSAVSSASSKPGVFPGLVYRLKFRHTTEECSTRVGITVTCANSAEAFRGAIAFGIGYMDGTSGLLAWRWLFIFRGAPSMLVVLFVQFLLSDSPETVKWLSVEEEALAIKKMHAEGSHSICSSPGCILGILPYITFLRRSN
jgi:hypothetical protein